MSGKETLQPGHLQTNLTLIRQASVKKVFEYKNRKGYNFWSQITTNVNEFNTFDTNRT